MIQEILLSILYVLMGFVGWYMTGIDDIIIFSHIFHGSKTKNEKIMAILGFGIAVMLMILFVFFVYFVFRSLLDFEKYYYIYALGAIIPFGLGVVTLKQFFDKSDIGLQSPDDYTIEILRKPFVLAFTGFFLNCTDDIVYNISIVLNEDLSNFLFYCFGLCIGAISMVVIVNKYSQKIDDSPLLRGIILIIVAICILYKSLGGA